MDRTACPLRSDRERYVESPSAVSGGRAAVACWWAPLRAVDVLPGP